jgi:hypothetical protein
MMQRLFLIIREIVSQRIISSIVLITIVITLISVGIFSIVGDSFNAYIQKRFGSAIPPNYIKISPALSKNVGLFNVGENRNAKKFFQAIKMARRMQDVAAVYAYSVARVPTYASIVPARILKSKTLSLLFASTLNRRYATFLVCIGAPYAMIKKDIVGARNKKKWLQWEPGEHIPFLVPNMFIEAYNQSIAGAYHLPTLTPTRQRRLLGAQIDLSFNEASMMYGDQYESAPAEFVGVTEQVPSLALIVPKKVVTFYNKKFEKKHSHQYIYAYVKVKKHESVQKVMTHLKAYGVEIETKKALSQEIVSLKKNVNYVLKALMLVIMLIASIAISVSTIIAIFNRIEYYRIMRILGCSKLFIACMILVKYLSFGYIGAYASIWFIKKYVMQAIANFSIAGFKLFFNLAMFDAEKIILYGTIIPLFSIIPGIIKLYTKNLNAD